ncbi:MAG: hypothetical protein LRY54_03600 [Alphaproteobacteria bacterium]|nr:hypothetical protein [Alphaproteobacteria bacterium]
MNKKKPSSSKKTRYITPPHRLKTKAGTGGISETLIERAQFHIETIEIDFEPEAQKQLTLISSVLARLKTEPPPYEAAPLTDPIMQLKANGGMFRYQLISDVADIALNFLENLNTLNKAALEVIEAHVHTIKIILAHKLKGDGGKEGFTLIRELENVCQRYNKKYDAAGTVRKK